ncbi:MAG: hypothetical protein WC734_01720 [Patescibacteria group bacterium]|jgi:hypothetical protein
MSKLSKLFFIIPAVSFGIITAVGDFPHKTLIEVVCLWILPLIYVYLLLRSNLSIRKKLWYPVIMIVNTGIAEAIGIFLEPRYPMSITMSSWDWYNYRVFYYFIGIIQFVLFTGLIVVTTSKKINVVLSNSITGVVLAFYGWLSTSAFADYRPLLISKQLPIILALFVVVGYIFYRILKLRMNTLYSIVLTLIISFIYLYPTVYSSGV